MLIGQETKKALGFLNYNWLNKYDSKNENYGNC